eukprot:8578313-Ditylum_brightwellii.AAC.1
MMMRATPCMKGMRKRITKEKLQLLTGIAALFLPKKTDKMHMPSCQLLGLNTRSKYVSIGLENRA